MAREGDDSKASWVTMSDSKFLSKIQTVSKFKQRSHDTHHSIHLPELNARLNLGFDLPKTTEPSADNDPSTPLANLANVKKIEVVYLGNSMLERFKTTGTATRLGRLSSKGLAWNAGCGGDKNENVLYRLHEGLYQHLKTAQEDGRCNIKLIVLASGTNNLHVRRGLRGLDVESYRLLLQACLRVAPRCRVLACDVFYRKDVADGLVDAGNKLLRAVVEEDEWEGRVTWVEARGALGKEVLADHVHLDEEGYTVWDEVLWKIVGEMGLDFGDMKE
jgi:hypothetical protein